MAQLFDPIEIRGVRFRNRIGVSPMCQYSARDGFINEWHRVHLGSRAVGGAGLVLTEATAVEARGRISPFDLGIWDDAHIEGLVGVARFIREQGAVPGIQLAHAGRKASTARPWEGGKGLTVAQGGWDDVVGPSALPFSPSYRQPRELSTGELREVRAAFVAAARRALAADFSLLELHGAHGYLMHSFLSPLSNQRSDEYGGSFDNRVRFVLELVNDVRAVWPTDRVFAVRLSCTDWVSGGWTLDDTVALAKLLQQAGVDLVDCSSGGTAPKISVPLTPGYQVGFAEAVKHATTLATAAVGLITEPTHANEIIERGQADFVFLARALLRDPYWPLHAARTLGLEPHGPAQYARAF